MSHYHKLLQRSPGGVSSILNISGVRIVEESTKTPPPPPLPYQWAWNLVGETVGGPGQSVPGDGIAVREADAVTLSQVATGVQWATTGTSPYADHFDEEGTLGLISGDLNAADKNAYYMHSLIDFSGSPELEGALKSITPGLAASDLDSFELYWFNSVAGSLGDGSTPYEGSNAIQEFTMTNNVTVLVHDLRNQDGRYGSESVDGNGQAGDWVNRDTEAPLRLENYFNLIAAVGETFIHHGYILADRILSESDIGSLPIDISKARS